MLTRLSILDDSGLLKASRMTSKLRCFCHGASLVRVFAAIERKALADTLRVGAYVYLCLS